MFDNKVLRYSSFALGGLAVVDIIVAFISLITVYSAKNPGFAVSAELQRIFMWVFMAIALLEMTAALVGISGSKKTEKGAKCLYWGIALALALVVYVTLYIIMGADISIWFTVLLAAAIAGYITGAVLDVRALKK